MSTTQKAIRQRMLQLEPDLGRLETVASLAATSVTVTALATGTVQTDKYLEKWMLRPDTSTTADRVRMVSDFTNTTGALTHAGANYADTTVGSPAESVEIHEYEPRFVDEAIQEALRRTRFLDESYMPASVDGRYWLDGFSWIQNADDIVQLGFRNNPVLTPNRYFAKWVGNNTDGAQIPDDWTVTAGTSFTRSTTTRRGPYSLSLTGTSSTVDYVIPVKALGGSLNSLRGKTVTAVLVSRSANASSHRVQVIEEDASASAITTTSSSYHTGDGTWQEMTAQVTIGSTTEQIRLRGAQDVDETGLFNELYLIFGIIGDQEREDRYRTLWEDRIPHWSQGQPLLVQSYNGLGDQFVIRSYRPYTEFDSARVLSGSADADTTDAPLDLIARSAIFHLYASFEPNWRESSSVEAQKARKWYASSSAAKTSHLANQESEEMGVGEAILASRSRAYVRRVR